MRFLDTNIFLFAAGVTHPLREPCRNVLRKTAQGSLSAITSTEVVQEILHVLARRNRPAEGVALARRLLALFPDMLPVTNADMALACEFMERYPEIPVRDCVHVATMLGNGLETIVSADRHFDLVAEITRLDPAEV